MWNWWKNVLCRFEYIKLHSTSGYEQGGTAIITHSRSTAHTKEAGGDDRQLGRWNWITVQGKGNKKTTIFSIYRPRKEQQTSNRQLARIRKNVEWRHQGNAATPAVAKGPRGNDNKDKQSRERYHSCRGLQ